MFTNEFTYTSSIYHLTLCIDHWSLFSTILRQVNQNQCWHWTLASVVQCLQLLQPEINNKKKNNIEIKTLIVLFSKILEQKSKRITTMWNILVNVFHFSLEWPVYIQSKLKAEFLIQQNIMQSVSYKVILNQTFFSTLCTFCWARLC